MRAWGLALALAALPAAGNECSTPELEAEVAESAAVFVGRVVGVDRDEIDFEVLREWKGPGSAHLEVRPSGYGPPFLAGRTYLVFARGADGFVAGQACSWTGPIERSCDNLRALGAPLASRRPIPWLLVAITAGMLAGVAGVRRWRGGAVLLGAAAVGFAALTAARWPSARPWPLPAEREKAAVELWGAADAGRGRIVAELADRVSGNRPAAAFERGGDRVVTSTGEGTTCVWPLDGGPSLACVEETFVGSLGFGPTIAVAAQYLRLRDPGTLELESERAVEGTAVRVTPEGAVLVSGRQSVALEQPDGGSLYLFAGEEPEAAFSGDGSRFAVVQGEPGPDGEWRVVASVHSVASGERIAAVERACIGLPGKLALDDRGDTLAWAGPDGLIIFDVAHNRRLAKLAVGIDPAPEGLLSPDGRLLLTGGARLQVWDLATRRELYRVEEDASRQIHPLDVARESGLIAAGGAPGRIVLVAPP